MNVNFQKLLHFSNIDLRSKNINSRRQLIAYRNCRWCTQHAGCHTISDTTRRIPEYVNLEKPEKYTGHGLKRSALLMLVEGGDLLSLKWHSGWLSSTVTECFIEEFINGKIEVSCNCLIYQ